MKTIKSRFFFIIICLFEVMQTFAAPNPPQPNPNKTNESPPPGLPIDTGVYVLFLLALLYGIYVIYIHTQKTKTPL